MKILLDLFWTLAVLSGIGIFLMALPVVFGLVLVLGGAYFVFACVHSTRLANEAEEREKLKRILNGD